MNPSALPSELSTPYFFGPNCPALSPVLSFPHRGPLSPSLLFLSVSPHPFMCPELLTEEGLNRRFEHSFFDQRIRKSHLSHPTPPPPPPRVMNPSLLATGSDHSSLIQSRFKAQMLSRLSKSHDKAITQPFRLNTA